MGSAKILTVLGSGPYKEMVYTLAGKRSSKVKCAPLAILELLHWPRGCQLIAFLTEEAAKAHRSYLKEEVEKRGHEFTCVSIPIGSNEKELWEIFKAITQSVEEGDELAVDLTHGFRSLPILMLGALIFLKEARKLTLKGLFYGALEARQGNEAPEPIFDLTRLVDMVEWAHGVRIFRKYGHSDDMGRILARIQDEIQKGADTVKKPEKLKSLGKALEELSAFLSEGIPLEIGNAAFKIGRLDINMIRDEVESFAPPASLLLDDLTRGYTGMAIPRGGSGGEWKRKIALDLAELAREAEVVDWYLEQGQERLALALMREWMVNRVILAMGNEEHWLSYPKARKKAERRLNVLAEMKKQGRQMNDTQQVLAAWWREVAERRNAIAHCGFKEEVLKPSLYEVKETWTAIKGKLTSDPYWDVSRWPVRTGKVLLSPLGLSKGLLYSAICQVEPVELVVVTSKDAERAIPEILERARWAGASPRVLTMEDPHAGFEETERLKADALPSLLEAEEVVANQTGGTTAMQFVIQSICKELEKYDVPLEEVALVDRRSPEQQRTDPYQVGELVRLGREPA
jgi:CRISPR-associated DxTHG motif protein